MPRLTSTRLTRLAVALATCAALLSTPAMAQVAEAIILGTVRDASTQAPLPGALVTVTSPNMPGVKTQTTDRSGNYQIRQLPVGIYAVRFSAEGHRAVKHTDIRLRPGGTVRVNGELPPSAPH